MPKHIYVNLHVKDLERSIAFFTKLGYAFNPQFTDEKAACLIISDTIFVMLLVEPFFESLQRNPFVIPAIVLKPSWAFQQKAGKPWTRS